jgi:hypothetical protein
MRNITYLGSPVKLRDPANRREETYALPIGFAWNNLFQESSEAHRQHLAGLVGRDQAFQ